MGIRLVVVDDNPHLRWDGAVYPRNATFEHFAAGLLDLPGRPVERLIACLPVAPADGPPRSRPLDRRIEIVETAPFEGIAGFLRRAAAISRRNAPRLREAIGAADLVWLKVPASNALLAAWLAHRAGRPRCVWVAGSAAAVARTRFSGPARLGAVIVGRAYDLIGRLVGLGGHRIVVGADLVRADGSPGEGLVASLVEAAEIRAPGVGAGAGDVEAGDVGAGGELGVARSLGSPERPLRLAYAGRLAPGKGLEVLLDAVRRLAADAWAVDLDLIGDGPLRPDLEARAAALGLADQVAAAGSADQASPLGPAGQVPPAGPVGPASPLGPVGPASVLGPAGQVPPAGLAGRVTFAGYLAERAHYLDRLARADLFVHPSSAEGFPKVVLDAMAVGLPVVAVPAGQLAPLVRAGIVAGARPEASDLAATIAGLAADPVRRSSLAAAGSTFVARHTRSAEAARLVARWQAWWPDLPW